MGFELHYRPPGPVARDFLRHRPAALGEDLPIDGIIGPIGSGKTGSCIMRIFMHATEQPPGADGWRRSRWAIVRNTNPMLETTTIPSVLDWFPEAVFGKFNWSPPYSYVIRLAEAKLELELWFIPLDRPEQVRNLLSMEVTGAWVNEAREVPREILIGLRRRCGRYPSLRSGAKPGWAGVLFDTNAPEDDLHYLALWAGWTEPPDWMDPMTRQLMTLPEGVTIFVQPPGLFPVRDERGRVSRFNDNPAAENLRNLRPGYYRSQLSGSTVDEVLNLICVEVRKSAASRPVHPQFHRETHVAPRPIAWDPAARSALIGMDFARNPATVLAQEVGGQLRFIREWVGQNISVEMFTRNHVVPVLNAEYPGWAEHLRGWGDPSGGNRTGGDDSTAFTHARKEGLPLVKAWTNDPDERRAALERRLTRMVDGAPAAIFCPKGCPTLISGLAGGFRYRRIQVEGTVDRFAEEVEKNIYSHVCEAAEYLALGLDRRGTKSEAEKRKAAAAGPGTPNGRTRVDPLAMARFGGRLRGWQGPRP